MTAHRYSALPSTRTLLYAQLFLSDLCNSANCLWNSNNEAMSSKVKCGSIKPSQVKGHKQIRAPTNNSRALFAFFVFFFAWKILHDARCALQGGRRALQVWELETRQEILRPSVLLRSMSFFFVACGLVCQQLRHRAHAESSRRSGAVCFKKWNGFIFHHCPCSQCWKIKMLLFHFYAGWCVQRESQKRFM